MTLAQRDRENVKKGEDIMANLINGLLKENRLDDALRVTEDLEYRKRLKALYSKE